MWLINHVTSNKKLKKNIWENYAVSIQSLVVIRTSYCRPRATKSMCIYKQALKFFED